MRYVYTIEVIRDDNIHIMGDYYRTKEIKCFSSYNKLKRFYIEKIEEMNKAHNLKGDDKIKTGDIPTSKILKTVYRTMRVYGKYKWTFKCRCNPIE